MVTVSQEMVGLERMLDYRKLKLTVRVLDVPAIPTYMIAADVHKVRHRIVRCTTRFTSF